MHAVSVGTVSPPARRFCLEGQLAPGCASRVSVLSVRSFSSTSPHTGSLDHGPHPSRAHDMSMESLACLTDLCQAAAPAAAVPTGLGGGSRSASITRNPCFPVYPSPLFRTFIH